MKLPLAEAVLVFVPCRGEEHRDCGPCTGPHCDREGERIPPCRECLRQDARRCEVRPHDRKAVQEAGQGTGKGSCVMFLCIDSICSYLLSICLSLYLPVYILFVCSFFTLSVYLGSLQFLPLSKVGHSTVLALCRRWQEFAEILARNMRA